MSFKTLTIIIPVYNEIDTLEQLLSKVRSVNLPLEREIIIIDDASSDGTDSLVKSLPGTDLVKLYHQVNRGKGAVQQSEFDGYGDLLQGVPSGHFATNHSPGATLRH